MKTSKFFSAAVVAIAMLATGSSMTSCSKDSDDTAPVKTEKVASSQETTTQTQTAIKEANSTKLAFNYIFGLDFFKAFDVKVEYTGTDGKLVTENITEANCVKKPCELSMFESEVLVFNKYIEYKGIAFPFTPEFQLKLEPKAVHPQITGGVGLGVHCSLRSVDKNDVNIDGADSKTVFKSFQLGIGENKASVYLEILKRMGNVYALDHFTFTIDKDGTVKSSHSSTSK